MSEVKTRSLGFLYSIAASLEMRKVCESEFDPNVFYNNVDSDKVSYLVDILKDIGEYVKGNPNANPVDSSILNHWALVFEDIKGTMASALSQSQPEDSQSVTYVSLEGIKYHVDFTSSIDNVKAQLAANLGKIIYDVNARSEYLQDPASWVANIRTRQESNSDLINMPDDVLEALVNLGNALKGVTDSSKCEELLDKHLKDKFVSQISVEQPEIW